MRASDHGSDREAPYQNGSGHTRRLLGDDGSDPTRLKIASTIGNAKAFLEVQEAFGSFNEYVWMFVEGTPRKNRWRAMSQIPARTGQSDAMSRDLRGRGFSFVGSTICYAFMQAAGLVNDHVVGCFRYGAVARARGSRSR